MSDPTTPDYFKVVRDSLEVVSFITAPILAWLAFKALAQIKVARDIARMQAQRESFRLATERCEQFAKEILPLVAEVGKLIEQKKLQDLQKVTVTETPGSISIDWKEGPKWMDELNKSGPAAWKLANQLEGWSMWFTCQIADEGIAFRPCGVSFCVAVRKILPLLVVTNGRDKLFTHTLRLYTTWRDKIEFEKNIAKQQELEKERKTLKVENIKPIGT